MASDNKVTIELELLDKMSDRLDKIGGSVEELEKTIKKSTENSSKAWDTFKGVLSAEAAIEGIKFLGEAASKAFEIFIVDGVKAASATQEALNGLNGALAANGNLLEGTSESMAEFAQQLQQTSKFTDDAVLSAASLLESLTGLDEEGLQGATQAAADLAARFNIDLSTAAQKVGLALEGNTAALKKQGIQFEEGETKAETYANALAAINEVAGGAAAQSTQTFAGGLDQIKKNFEDLTKVTGEAVIENNVIIAVFSEVGKILGEAAESFSENKDSIKEFIGQGVIAAIEALQALLPVLSVTYDTVETGVAIFKAAGQEIGVFAAAIVQAAEGNFKAAFDTLKEGSAEAGETISKTFGQDNPIDKLAPSLERINQAAQEGFAAMKEGVESTIEPLNAQRDAITEITAAQQELIDKGIELFNKTLEQDPTEKYAADLEALRAAKEAEELTQQEFDEARIVAATERDKKLRELDEKRAADLFTLIESQKTLDANGNAELIASNRAKLQAMTQDENVSAVTRAAINKKLKDEQIAQDRERTKAGTDALDQLASLQNSKTKEIAAVGKAAAIAKATIDTYTGASAAATALAGIPIVGPGLAVAAAAAFIAAGIARVATIAGTPLATGIDSVPGVGNSDNFPALLTPGERVVPKNTNQDLRTFLDDQGGQTDLLAGILAAIQGQQSNVTVNVGSKEIVNEVRDQLQSGRSLT